MRRPFVGVVVPELEANPDTEQPGAKLFSRLVLLDLDPASPNAAEAAERRAKVMHGAVNTARSLVQDAADLVRFE